MIRKRTLSSLMILLVLATFIAAACGKQEKPTEELDDGTTGFSFEFSSWTVAERKNIWSTEKKRIQKDLVFDGVAGDDWIITKKDLAKVEALIREYQVTQMKDELDQYLETVDGFLMMTPPVEYELSFSFEGQRYFVSFSGAVLSSIPKEDPRYKYNIFIDKLVAILVDQETYRNLPKANGAYN